jgi:hypothetical protein
MNLQIKDKLASSLDTVKNQLNTSFSRRFKTGSRKIYLV